MEKLKNCELERVSPESVGIKSSTITAFINEINQKKLGVHSFTIVRHNKICSQCFWKPYSQDYPHVLYSMSKSITSTAVGFAVDEGLLKLDDRVYKFFPEIKVKGLINKSLTVRMLLTMKSDKLITVLEEKGGTDWVKNFFEAPFLARPNSKFNYISENTFMLSAIVSKVTGMSILDYLYPRMFEPLGIEKPYWEHDGKGNNAGGWGLYMKSTDLAKFFLPYINEGKFKGTQLVPAQWVKEATARQTESVHDGYIDNVCGYGYQFWRNQIANSYRADGLFGQRCFMFPDCDALVVMNCGESEDYNVMKVFWKYFPNAFEYEKLPENKEEQAELEKAIQSCSMEDLPKQPRNEKMEKFVEDVQISCKSNDFASVLSITVMNMLYNKPGNISKIKFNFKENSLLFTWKEKEYVNTIEAGLDGEYRVSEITLGDLNLHTYSKAAWQNDGKLKLWIRPIETAHVRQFTFDFEHGDEVKITNEMMPRFQDLVIYYFAFAGHPIHGEITEDTIKSAFKTLGLPIIEPDFKGKFDN